MISADYSRTAFGRGTFAEKIVRSTPLDVTKNGPKRGLAQALRVTQMAQPNARQNP
jgi:hypothetical protein